MRKMVLPFILLAVILVYGQPMPYVHASHLTYHVTCNPTATLLVNATSGIVFRSAIVLYVNSTNGIWIGNSTVKNSTGFPLPTHTNLTLTKYTGFDTSSALYCVTITTGQTAIVDVLEEYVP